MCQSDPDAIDLVMAFQRKVVAHEPVAVALDCVGRRDLGKAFDGLRFAYISGMKDAIRVLRFNSAQQSRLNHWCAISHVRISENNDALV